MLLEKLSDLLVPHQALPMTMQMTFETQPELKKPIYLIENEDVRMLKLPT